MKKYRFFLKDLEREEIWINSYIEQGYRLKAINVWTGRYDFEKCDNTQNVYTVRTDYRTFSNQEEFLDYVSLFQDSGWHLIWGTKSSGILYFEKMNKDAVPEIFSDNDSKAERCKRVLASWGNILFLYVVLMGLMVTNNQFDLSILTNPKSLYYTPGLWEMEGSRFVKAFLFETPFALGRGYSGVLILFLTIVFACMTVKTAITLWKTKKN